jgi:hypothetical protein
VGGAGDDPGWLLALDEDENVVVMGRTNSTDFPTTPGVYDTTPNGNWDLYALKLSADGTALLHSTYLGGSGHEDVWMTGLKLDESGNVVVTGWTESSNFPITPDAFDTGYHGQRDAFALKLSADGSELIYGTYLGGSGYDVPGGLVLDKAGSAIISGSTGSFDFPTTEDAYDATNAGGADAFILKLDASGSTLMYGTFVGGSGGEHGHSLVLDAAGNLVVSGTTSSPSFPVTSEAYDTTHNGGFDTFVLKLSAINRPPSLEISQPSITVNEGQVASNGGTVTDADGDTITLTVSAGEVTNLGDGTWSWSLPTTDGPTESQTVTIYADDGTGGIAEATFELVVHNVAPTIDVITGPVDPVNINDQPVAVEVLFSDPGTGDTHSVTWNWGDGTDDTQSNVTSPATYEHSYAEPGVYAVELTVADDDGGSATALYEFIVVYDPDGAFVTGGGWIESAAGAYTPDPALSGQASFGFVSKYKKGATVPTGNTEFQFHASGLNFRSSSYAWLIVTGSDYARYKGLGTINGELAPEGEPYKFLLWAGDDEPDTFRIKIWWDDGETETVVYDNGMDQAIGGGSVVIHIKK